MLALLLRPSVVNARGVSGARPTKRKRGSQLRRERGRATQTKRAHHQSSRPEGKPSGKDPCHARGGHPFAVPHTAMCMCWSLSVRAAHTCSRQRPHRTAMATRLHALHGAQHERGRATGNQHVTSLHVGTAPCLHAAGHPLAVSHNATHSLTCLCRCELRMQLPAASQNCDWGAGCSHCAMRHERG